MFCSTCVLSAFLLDHKTFGELKLALSVAPLPSSDFAAHVFVGHIFRCIARKRLYTGCCKKTPF